MRPFLILILPAALGLLLAGCGVQPLEQKDLDELRKPATGSAVPPPTGAVPTRPGPTAKPTAATPIATRRPKIIAKVGRSTIGFFRFRSLYVNRVRLLLRQGQLLMPGRKEQLAKNVMDALIVLELWHQEALRRGLLATDAEVEAYMRRELLPKVGGERGLRLHLRRQGQTLQVFRAELKSKLGTTKLMRQVSSQQNSAVTSEAIRAFFDENREKLRTPSRLRLAHMVLPAAGSTAQALAEASKKAQDALQRIRKGEAFVNVARSVTKCRSHLCGRTGGILPPYTVPPDRSFLQSHPALDKAVAAALPKLGPGQLSKPIRTGRGYEIVYLRHREGGEALTLAKASPFIEGRLRKEKVQKALDGHVAELRKKSKVEVFIPVKRLVELVDASLVRRRGRGGRRGAPGGMRGIPGGQRRRRVRRAAPGGS